MSERPCKLPDQVADAIRRKHYSYRTEQTNVPSLPSSSCTARCSTSSCCNQLRQCAIFATLPGKWPGLDSLPTTIRS